ncbi:RNA-binding region RNP-1 domain-containing protein [Balamuthia mandrillaris]
MDHSEVDKLGDSLSNISVNEEASPPILNKKEDLSKENREDRKVSHEDEEEDEAKAKEAQWKEKQKENTTTEEQQHIGEVGEGEDEEGSEDEFPEECCLFIGDLARGLNEEQLREPFEQFGVASIEIKRDKVTGFSLGYGFITFKTRMQASEAKKALHRSVIGGRAVRIGWAQKNTNLFIGDLDPSISNEQLREIFREFGPIYDEETFVKNRNYGFVRFRHRRHAEKAKREMDGKVLGSRAIRIGWGEANYQRHCVHLQFDAADSDKLSESDVINKFEEFGTIISVNLPRSQGQLRGFGFIYYEDTDEGEDAAAMAITNLNDKEICGVKVQCNFGKKPTTKKRVTTTNVRSPKGKTKHNRRLGHSSNGGSVNRSGSQTLYPVQVMMPVGPQGTWQPVQYMMTAQQANQFYGSMQYNPAVPPHSSPSPPRSDPQMMPMYYTYRSSSGSLDYGSGGGGGAAGPSPKSHVSSGGASGMVSLSPVASHHPQQHHHHHSAALQQQQLQQLQYQQYYDPSSEHHHHSSF